MQATHELGIDRISAQSRGLHIYYALRGYLELGFLKISPPDAGTLLRSLYRAFICS
jgi:hypothetical protein